MANMELKKILPGEMIKNFLKSENLNALPKVTNPRIAAAGSSAKAVLANPLLNDAFKTCGVEPADFAAYQTCEELVADKRWNLALVLAPCKPAAYELTRNHLTPAAVATHVVDTIVRTGDELLGVNTNSHAAGWAIQQLMGTLIPKQILVAGTSATARSVVIALHRLYSDSRIFIVGRSAQKAQAVIDICKAGETVQDIHSQTYDLVVHATSVGNAGDAQQLDYPLEDTFRPGTRFFDVIIGHTYLQQAALSKGCVVTSGAAMQHAASVLRAGLLGGK